MKYVRFPVWCVLRMRSQHLSVLLEGQMAVSGPVLFLLDTVGQIFFLGLLWTFQSFVTADLFCRTDFLVPHRPALATFLVCLGVLCCGGTTPLS